MKSEGMVAEGVLDLFKSESAFYEYERENPNATVTEKTSELAKICSDNHVSYKGFSILERRLITDKKVK